MKKKTYFDYAHNRTVNYRDMVFIPPVLSKTDLEFIEFQRKIREEIVKAYGGVK